MFSESVTEIYTLDICLYTEGSSGRSIGCYGENYPDMACFCSFRTNLHIKFLVIVFRLFGVSCFSVFQ